MKRELAEPGARNSTPHRFKHPVWDLRDVFGWVLDRDPAKFGRIHTETDWRSAAWGAKFYTTKFRPEHDPQAEQTLLHTLQRGELVAYDGNNPVAADFWLDKAPQRLRGFAPFLFRREDVLALWPDPRTQISRTPPPITPLSGGTAAAIINSIENDNRFPNWRIWKHIPDVKVYEAVALSLNIDPNKIRHSPHSWMTGRRLFEEGEKFRERIFLAERNLETLGVVNFTNVRYFDEDPVVGLQRFVTWAVSIGWSLPTELGEFAICATGEVPPSPSEAAVTPETKSVTLQQQGVRALPETKRRRGPERGSLDRYGEADRALFSELERICKVEHLSLTAAALKLAEGEIEGKTVMGSGSPLSRAKRLVKRYKSHHTPNPLKLAEDP